MRNAAGFVLFGVAACHGETTPVTAAGQDPGVTDAPLVAADLQSSWVQLAAPNGNQPTRIARDATGFVALTIDDTSQGKTSGVITNALYRSNDGVTWNQLPLPANPPYYAGLRDVAFGNGHYVLAGYGAAGGWLLTSTDGKTWTNTPEPGGIYTVTYVNDRFIALPSNDLLFSTDGVTWTTVSRPILQGRAATYGNGHFLVVGAIAFMASTDGATWTETTPSCTTPGAACVSPPGETTQIAGPYDNGVFGDGHFYVDKLASTDATTWQANAGPLPTASFGGYLFDTSNNNALKAWRGGEVPVSIAVEPATSAAGATCSDHRCVIVGESLYLLR